MKRLSFENVLLTFLLASLIASMESTFPPQLIIYYAELAYVPFDPTTIKLQLLETATCVGSIVGSFIISPIATMLGKRRATVYCAIAACIISVATLIPVGFGYLYFTRVCLGMFAYGCNAIAPGWLRELVSNTQLSMFFEVFIATNYLLCSGLTYLVLQPRLWWLPQIYGIVSAALCAYVAWEAEMTVGMDETALISHEDMPVHRRRNYTLCEPAVGKSLVNAVLIGVGVEVSGISRLMFSLYSTTMQQVEHIVITVLRVAIGAVMVHLNRRINRKTMMICGMFVGAAGNLGLAVAHYLKLVSQDERAQEAGASKAFSVVSDVFNVLGFVSLTVGYEVGPGFLQYLLCAEVFPRKYQVRLSAVVFATAATTQLLTYLFNTLMQAMPGYADLVLAVIALWNGVVLVAHMPESKGKTQQEIEKEVLGDYYLDDF